MAGPWEKYSSTPAPTPTPTPTPAGPAPWEKYSQAPAQEQSTTSKALQFAKGLPQSAIDLVPGMKERREAIEAGRDTKNYPEPYTGENDWAYQAMGLVGPESAVSALKAFPKVATNLREFLRPAAERARIAEIAKDPIALQEEVKGAIGQAQKTFGGREIAPRMQIQKQLADEQLVRVNPYELAGYHPEVDKALNEALQQHQKFSGEASPDTILVPANDAIVWRSKLNQNYENPGAREAGDKLRNLISGVDPAMEDLSKGMEEAYALKNQIEKSAKLSPQYTIKPGAGPEAKAGDKLANLEQFSRGSGVDLPQLGRSIEANEMRTGPIFTKGADLLTPIKRATYKTLGKLGGTAYDKAAKAIMPSLEAGAEAPSLADSLRRASVHKKKDEKR